MKNVLYTSVIQYPHHFSIIFGKMTYGANSLNRPLWCNSLRQNTRHICKKLSPNNVKQRITMYGTHMLNFVHKCYVPSWMFVDNFSRQTNNKHPHNPHSRKRAELMNDEAGSRDH